MEVLLNAMSIPAIATAVYWVINLIKYTVKGNEKFLRWIPLLSATLGMVFGLIAFLFIPGVMPTENIFVAIILGGASGLTATGFNQIFKQFKK